MNAAIDRGDIGPQTLPNALDRLNPSTDDSIPPIPAIRTLASHAGQSSRIENATIKLVIDEIEHLLSHDRFAVHHLAAAATIPLANRSPDGAATLAKRLVSDLDREERTRRYLVALEFLATTEPTALEQHLGEIVNYLGDTRAPVSCHAAGIVLALSQQSPGTVIEFLPMLLRTLEDKPHKEAHKIENSNIDVRDLEQDRRFGYELRRITIARAVAAVAEEKPDSTVEVVLANNATKTLVGLFEDTQPRVRAAAVSIAAYVAEQKPEPFVESVDTLQRLCEDDSQIVRAGAIFTLQAIGTEETINELKSVRQTEPVDELQALIEAAIENEDDMHE